uniref:uncharacterized protein LOC122608873 n=1 Tax=Erigeron canadensis TaxID=72917 RepID=UPI001CB95D0D|nr:uncharacterized protein LOC122608873 [Erigeron canadensis]
MALLPSFFILQSGTRYLNLTQNIPASLPSGFLKFDEEQIWSPRVKFAAEPAKTGDGRFVHIRSLYNNKYLVKKQIDGTKSWIIASAKEPEEDTSKDSCTLFEAYSLKDDQPTSIRLRQVQTQNSVTLTASSSEGDAQQQGLQLASSSSSTGSVFSVIDRESLVVLPSKIAFKSNEYYLQSKLIEGHGYQRFDPGLNIAEPTVAKELIPAADGNYRIRDEYWNQFLTRHGTWIWADSPDTNLSVDTKFSFVNIENNIFGLRSLGNNNFCGPFTDAGKTNCLNARYPTLTNSARLIVEERVLKREIFNLEYQLSGVKPYDEKPMSVKSMIVNNETDTETIDTLSYPLDKSRTTSWNNSQTINLGVSVSMSVTVVPFIFEGDIKLHTEFSSTQEWGETTTVEDVRKSEHKVTVPPHKTYRMTLMTTLGKCDVPFSYTQRDLSTTGEWVETRKDDGLFTGVNNYNFYYEVVDITE